MVSALAPLSSQIFAQAAQSATLPAGMVYDANGNLFLADSSRNQVLEVTVGGLLTIVAGTGVQGFDGDGGPATNALLNEPQGVAIGPDSTLYIADTGNRRIRAITQGVISTMAGNGSLGNAGDGGEASLATFDRPTALAWASGGLLVCDTANHRVRLISKGLIQAFAGNGTQGFSGDGGSATGAQLDSPQGVTVLPDGRVIIADSHNNRLRSITTNGVITTFAGNGASGYSGDGGPATAAKLSLPQGLSVTAGGAVIFADSNNQRVRMIDAAGLISTLAGSGVQGASADASKASDAAINSPRGIAISPYGAAAFGDSSVSALKAVVSNGNVYLVPAPVSRTSSVTLAVPQSLVYGQASAKVTVSGVTPQGNINLDEAGGSVGGGALANGAANIALSSLPAANHALVARYLGDGINPAANSSPVSVVVQPAPVTANANATTIAYGQPLPQLSGTLQGLLPQDAATVGVVFSTTATPSMDPGVYPIAASLTGSGSMNYALSNAASSGTLTIRQAQSSTALQVTSQTNYAGLPLLLSATVTPEFTGRPSGEVDFLENGTVLARSTAVNGAASATYLRPSAGNHAVTASFAGNTDFQASSSLPITVAVSALPDFGLQANAASETVQAGLIAAYVLSVASQSGPFTGSVSFSVSGLPAGAQATFAPVAVVPGSAGASTTLSIQTPAQHAEQKTLGRQMTWLALLPMFFVLRRRIRMRTLPGAACAVLLVGLGGCGARTVGTPTLASQTYPLVVSATSTNLAGGVVTHTLSLTLTVQ